MEPTEATPLEPTSVESWKQGKTQTEGEAFPLKVPSGNVALVRKCSLDEFLTSGLIPNPLIGVLEELFDIPDNHRAEEAEGKMGDLTTLRATSQLVDRVVIRFVVEPKVEPIPKCKNCAREEYDGIHHEVPDRGAKNKVIRKPHAYKDPGRDEDKLYVDQVEWDDKFAVYDFALSEASATESFRKEQGGDVESVPDGEEVQRTTK